MKKITMILIIVACLLFSGCVDGEGNVEVPGNEEYAEVPEKAEMSENEINDESLESTFTPDLIIKSSDVPELSLSDFRIFAIPKNEYHYLETRPEVYYMDSLPVDSRKVGEYSAWNRKWGVPEHGTLEYMTISVYEYDSGEHLLEQLIPQGISLKKEMTHP